MHTKFILERIYHRMTYSLKNSVAIDFNTDYTRGFEHATKLLGIAIEHEFKGHNQDQENKDQVIRDLKKQMNSLKMKCLGQQQNIHQMQVLLNKTANITLSNNKKKKIFRAVAEITGQPYEYVKEQFADLLDGKLVKRKGEFNNE